MSFSLTPEKANLVSQVMITIIYSVMANRVTFCHLS